MVGGLLCSLVLTVAIGACGSSTKKSSTHSTTAAAATTTSPTTYQNTLSTSTAPKHSTHHAKPAHKAHPATTTTSSGGVAPTSTSSTTHKSSSPTHTATASRSHGSGSSTAKKTTNSPPPPPPAPKPAPLPAPVVAASSGDVHASFHGQNHNPVAGQIWDYSVLATDGSGKALSGTVETEFVFNGTVVGRESPSTHPLKNGRLDDTVTFPARALGIPLSVQVVVHTPAGSVTLDWPVKARR